MAFLFVDLTQNNSKYIQFSVKIIELLLLSAGLFSTLLMLKGALPPFSCSLVFSSLIEFWTSATCFFPCPLSICISIHLIVVLILASSSFFSLENSHKDDETSIIVGDHVVHLADLLSPPPLPPPEPTEHSTKPTTEDEDEEKDTTWKAKNKHLNKIQTRGVHVHVPPTPPPEPTEPSTTPTKKDKDEDEEKNNTMDATWKAITGDHNQKAKNKHLNKIQTWDHVHVPPPRAFRLDSEILLPTTPKWKELRKAETFNDAVSATRRGGLIRRDPSMSIDEFNLRVEAFIKNFNDDIRLQRQESDQRFFETINRGRV